MTEEEIRTEAQNNWIHPIFREIANECNARGIGQKIISQKLFTKDFPATETSIKGNFQEIMLQVTGKKSTTQLTKKELSDLMEMFLWAWGQRLGISVTYEN